MPYVDELVSIGKADNGYIIELRAPVKKGQETSCGCCIGPGSDRKTILCVSVEDVSAKLQKLLPALDDQATTDEAFEDAFEQACGANQSKGAD